MRDELRNRAVLAAAIVAVAFALLGTYTWTETAATQCPRVGACLEGQTHRIHPLRARIEWAAAVVMVVGAASLAVTGGSRTRP
jgi:LPS O-antigen subunit length determinant protein (WzzB/FepE family)